MAATIPHLCPYCGHDNIVFTVIHAVQRPTSIGAPAAIFECQASCGACHRCAVITLESEDRHSPLNHAGAFNVKMNSALALVLIDFQPKQTPKEPPRHLPEDVERSMYQAYRNESRQDLEPAVIMARKAVERAIKYIAPNTTGMLAQRIKQLGRDNILPQPMLDWAGELRLIGNSGAHDADLGDESAEEVRQAILFAETFLTYTITMPEEIRIKRKRKA